MRLNLGARALAGLTVAAVVLAGCGTDESGTGSPAATTATGSSTSPETSATTTASATTSAANTCGAAELKGLTLRQRLAQLLMVGVADAADARGVVQAEQIGGIFIGSWSDLSMLTDGSARKIAAGAKTPLMVSVDQEGGRVSRLKNLGIDWPSARQLVAQGKTPEQVRQLAAENGEKMRKLGITVDFAPVVDVSAESDDQVIGDRSFSDDPQVVTEYAQAFAQGLQDAGIMPVFKHFPGHGSGSGDSHLGAVRTPPLSELVQSDLVPYRMLLAEPGNAGVMVGHLIVPGLTAGDTPASISRAAIGMLRTGTKYDGPRFNGVVFTDDLSGMKAITDKYSIEQAVLKSIQAGADVGLWLTTDRVPSVLDALEEAVKSGDLTRARVDRSVIRILRAKGVLDC